MSAEMVGLLGQLSRHKHLLGFRLARFGPRSPVLEASTATIAIAQEELGHARLFHTAALRFKGDGTTEAEAGLVMAAVPTQTDEIPAFETWTDVVAGMAVVDSALSAWLESLVSSGPAWLQERAQRMAAEEEFHRDCVEGWVQLLASHPATAAAFRKAVARQLAAWKPAWEVLVATGNELYRRGELPTPGNSVDERFRRALDEVMARETG